MCICFKCIYPLQRAIDPLERALPSLKRALYFLKMQIGVAQKLRGKYGAGQPRDWEDEASRVSLLRAMAYQRGDDAAPSAGLLGSMGVLQCVAVRCSALQCVAVRCSVLQCATVWCSAL